MFNELAAVSFYLILLVLIRKKKGKKFYLISNAYRTDAIFNPVSLFNLIVK